MTVSREVEVVDAEGKVVGLLDVQDLLAARSFQAWARGPPCLTGA
jgi:CBS-domain-containing membrane protein